MMVHAGLAKLAIRDDGSVDFKGVSEIGVAGVASMVFSLTVVGLRMFAVVDGD